MPRKPPASAQNATSSPIAADIRQLIWEARAGLAATLNSALTLLYWRIGHRIRTEVLQGSRAGYGEQLVATLARELEAEHGRGFSAKNMHHMLRFAEVFESEEIVYALSRQLSWTQLRTLIYIDDPLKRDFYLDMCRSEGWSTRTLQGRLDSMLFERTALSRKPDELLATELATLREEGEMSPDLVLKDPPTSWTSWDCRTASWRRTWRMRSFASWRTSCWSWARASPSWRARSGCRSTTRTSTSICCSITGASGAWWPSS